MQGNLKIRILKNDFQVVRCFGWLVSFKNITLPTAHENVENNSNLIAPLFDKMAKWLRKLNANLLDSDRMVSNPVFVMLSIRCMEI